MNRELVVLPAAEADLKDGEQFYEEQSEGLGSYFYDTVFATIDSLLIHSGIHRKVYGYHRCISRHFPYAVYYRVQAETVFVYAVLDCRRNPREIRRRLRAG